MRFAALMLTFCLTISEIFVGSGCAPTPPPKAARAALTTSLGVGEIAIVDKEKHFVLVDLESNLYVPLEAELDAHPVPERRREDRAFKSVAGTKEAVYRGGHRRWRAGGGRPSHPLKSEGIRWRSFWRESSRHPVPRPRVSVLEGLPPLKC